MSSPLGEGKGGGGRRAAKPYHSVARAGGLAIASPRKIGGWVLDLNLRINHRRLREGTARQVTLKIPAPNTPEYPVGNPVPTMAAYFRLPSRVLSRVPIPYPGLQRLKQYHTLENIYGVNSCNILYIKIVRREIQAYCNYLSGLDTT